MATEAIAPVLTDGQSAFRESLSATLSVAFPTRHSFLSGGCYEHEFEFDHERHFSSLSVEAFTAELTSWHSGAT